MIKNKTFNNIHTFLLNKIVINFHGFTAELFINVEFIVLSKFIVCDSLISFS